MCLILVLINGFVYTNLISIFHFFFLFLSSLFFFLQVWHFLLLYCLLVLCGEESCIPWGFDHISCVLQITDKWQVFWSGSYILYGGHSESSWRYWWIPQGKFLKSSVVPWRLLTFNLWQKIHSIMLQFYKNFCSNLEDIIWKPPHEG